MTVVDLDDTIFGEDSRRPVEEMDMIAELAGPDDGGEEEERDDPPEQWDNEAGASSQQQHQRLSRNNSGGSAQFQYPATLDDEETALTGAARARDGNGNSSPKKKRVAVQKNRDFKDVEETGTWGTAVSRREILGVGTLALLVVAGVAVGLFVWLRGSGSDTNNINSSGGPSANITDEKFYLSRQEHYDDLLRKINQHHPAAAETLLRTFPAAVDDLAGDDVYSEAALWLFFTDEIPIKWERNILPRFTLAVTYIANGGTSLDSWMNQENWMSVKEVCDWHGVACDGRGRVLEVDLAGNGLTGPLHEAWILLPDCESILLSDNALTGPIPGHAFGNMAKLVYLHLDGNQLTGTIPLSLKDTDSLDTLMVQGNELTGWWPQPFCPSAGSEPPFTEFGIDCHRVLCSCCVQLLNCFNSE